MPFDRHAAAPPRHGAKVISVSNEALNCQTVTDAITAEGNEGMAYQADCTKGEEVQGLVDAVMAKYVAPPHPCRRRRRRRRRRYRLRARRSAPRSLTSRPASTSNW